MRKSAEERREEILTVAMEHFAAGGYHGTSTEVIARQAGISQPYLFRLFRTKRELFFACNDRACEKIIDAFRRAVVDQDDDCRMDAMGQAYIEELLPDRHAILMLLQGYAAAGSDPAIREHVRDKYAEVVDEVARLSGEPPDKVWQFFAIGMQLNVVAALDLAESDHPMFREWTALHA
jgi:AcrR family transcriptional regulator